MVIRCQNDIAELQQILMGLMNSSRSWSKEGSAEKQGYLSGKDKEIQQNSQYLQDPCGLDETRGKSCIREPARVSGLQNVAKAYMCWDYVSNLALLPVIRHNQC